MLRIYETRVAVVKGSILPVHRMFACIRVRSGQGDGQLDDSVPAHEWTKQGFMPPPEERGTANRIEGI